MIPLRLLLLLLFRAAWIASLLAGLYLLVSGSPVFAILMFWSVPNWMMLTGMAKRSLRRRRRALALRAYRIAHRDCCDVRRDRERWNTIIENFHTIREEPHG